MAAERRGDDDAGAADASAGEFVTPPEPGSEQGGQTRISQQPDKTRISQPPAETRISEQPDRTRVAEQPAFATSSAGDEPVVEGTAVELPDEPAAAQRDPAGPTVERLQPSAPADEPVAVATPGQGPDPVTTLGDSGEAYASGHAKTSGRSSWQEPVMKLANERPEIVVAAAFAGGLLAAMILRRLGN